ncbi:TonB domain-containing protein [Yersinia frederiksenii]|nr:TonB domain-containing protein [Yersinia frederiksenii]
MINYMKIRQNNNRMTLWLSSAILASCVHAYLLWWLSLAAIPTTVLNSYPMAVMVRLAAEPAFTPNVEPHPVVGITQNASEAAVDPTEEPPEQTSELLTAPESPNAILNVEKEREIVKKQQTKPKRPQQDVTKPRKPVTEETLHHPSKSSLPAATASTSLSGQSHETAAAMNSDSLHMQQIKMNWRSRLQGHLIGFKRYPPIAKKQRQQGIATIRFIVNQDGNVLSAQLVKSSGVAILDREALALIKRAQPLPKPPNELLSHGQITLALPIGFDLKNKS